MENQEIKEVNLNFKIADAGAGGWIAYTVATFISWAYLVGLVNDNATILMACISVACAIPYLTAAATEIKLGNLPGGVTWLYFGSFFAVGSALTYTVTYFAGIYGWSLDSRILGYSWFVVSLVLIATTPVFIKFGPTASATSIIMADIGLLSLAFGFWGLPGFNWFLLSGWSLLVAGIFGFWMAITIILESAGIKVTKGK